MVDDELVAAMRRAPAPGITSRRRRAVMRAAIRVMPIPSVPGARLEKASAGGVPIRIFRPTISCAGDTRRPAVLWLHGGGLVIGHPRQDDHLCRTTAVTLGCVVVSPDYRLAPRHPFPAAHDDCRTVWQWMQTNSARLGIDEHRVALGGQSAGAGIAMGLALRLRDLGSPMPRALWLFAPMLDDRTAARRDLDEVDHVVWNNVRNRFGWHAYLDAEPGRDDVSQYAAPARATHVGGLPPAWVGVGSSDLFLDEATELVTRLRSAGSAAEIEVVPDGFHGFESLARRTAAAQQYLRAATTWLASQLQPADPCSPTR